MQVIIKIQELTEYAKYIIGECHVQVGDILIGTYCKGANTVVVETENGVCVFTIGETCEIVDESKVKVSVKRELCRKIVDNGLFFKNPINMRNAYNDVIYRVSVEEDGRLLGWTNNNKSFSLFHNFQIDWLLNELATNHK